jgi:hypothetical protein
MFDSQPGYIGFEDGVYNMKDGDTGYLLFTMLIILFYRKSREK